MRTAITDTFKEINKNYLKDGTITVQKVKSKKNTLLKTELMVPDIGLGDDMGITAGEIALRIALLAPNLLPRKKEDIAELNLAIAHEQPFIQDEWLKGYQNKNIT